MISEEVRDEKTKLGKYRRNSLGFLKTEGRAQRGLCAVGVYLGDRRWEIGSDGLLGPTGIGGRKYMERNSDNPLNT